MAIPDLEFPDLSDEPIDRIWEAIKSIIRADKNLKVLRTIRLWEGDVEDAYPPSEGDMPFLRVTPMNSRMAPGDEASWLTDLAFKYELAVEGTKIRNLFRLNGAFRKAFNYDAAVGSSNVLQTVQGAGAVVHSFQLAAIGPLNVPGVNPTATGYPIQNLAAAGTFMVRTYISAIS